jgi:hypothetical protein
MADRTPVFEMHILPMFRLLDRRHMLRVDKHLDLWDYDSVKAKANAIVTRAVGDRPSMPTPGTGGAWPVEWRAVFKRWVAGGFVVCPLEQVTITSSPPQMMVFC